VLHLFIKQGDRTQLATTQCTIVRRLSYNSVISITVLKESIIVIC